MNEPRPFLPNVFLYRMLATIFIVEAMFLGFAFYRCSERRAGEPQRLVDRCPRLGDRATELFGVSVATCLSLLSGVMDNPD